MAKEREIKVRGAEQSADQAEHDEPESIGSSNTEETSTDAGNDPLTAQPELTEEERLRAQVGELEARLLRAHADFDNFRKRVAQRQDELVNGANDQILLQLLEVLDNFERALLHARDDESAEAVRRGMELIHEQIKSLIAKYRVRPIEAIGESFDPRYHEAMMQMTSDEFEAGTVALEMAKGYMIDKRVLRHSKVGVSRGSAEEDRAGETERTDGEDSENVSE